MSLKQKYLFVGIILLAVFFRFYQIFSMPGGIFPDEAANGLDINSMQQGQLQPFYERGNGREALFFYMEWLSTEVFGKGQWQMHATSALVGVLTVALVYFVTRRLFLMNLDDKQATNIALLASFLVAVSSWHVVLSRTAFRANLIPLFSSLTFYLLLCAYQAKKHSHKLILSFLTGAAFALGFYTYIAYRILVPIVIILIAWPLLAKIREGKFWQTVISYKALAISFLLAFTIFFYPLGHYFFTHEGSFVGRSGQVSVFNPELNKGDLIGAIQTVFYQSMRGYFVDGDLNWRHNISGYGFLSPLISPFFGIGLIIATFFGAWYFFAPNKRWYYWKFFLLGMWFWGLLVPVITTAEGIPHGLRAIGTLPPAFIIAAWAIYEFWRLAKKMHHRLWQYCLYHYKDPQWIKDRYFVPIRMRIINWSLKLLAVCFVFALILQTYYLYFVYAANSPEYFYAFRADLTPVSEYLRQRCDSGHTYLILDKFSVQTTDYLTSDPKGNFSDKCSVPYQQVDPENSWELGALQKGDEVIFTQSSIFDIKKFKQHHPEARLRLELRNKFGQSVMGVYEIN